jgi:hypothetical protein
MPHVANARLPASFVRLPNLAIAIPSGPAQTTFEYHHIVDFFAMQAIKKLSTRPANSPVHAMDLCKRSTSLQMNTIRNARDGKSRTLTIFTSRRRHRRLCTLLAWAVPSAYAHNRYGLAGRACRGTTVTDAGARERWHRR